MSLVPCLLCTVLEHIVTAYRTGRTGPVIYIQALTMTPKGGKRNLLPTPCTTAVVTAMEGATGWEVDAMLG